MSSDERVERFDWNERLAEKERARVADERTLRLGLISPEELKKANESFAFPKDRVRIDLGSARSLS